MVTEHKLRRKKDMHAPILKGGGGPLPKGLRGGCRENKGEYRTNA